MGRLFGTDGVRGVAGRDLTAQLAMDLAVAGAGVLSGTGPSATEPSPTGPSATGALADGPPRGRRPVAVVGRDPRTSGEFLEAAVVAGLASSGVDVLRLGVIPTPAVAFLTAALDADFGVMLSASHNPARDNGIKFFARGGLKLPDAAEDEIERRLAPVVPIPVRPTTVPSTTVPSTTGLTRATLPELGFGRVTDASGERERYLDHLLSTLPGSGSAAPLTGLRVVVDCAHGAAYEIAPRMLRRAGAEVIAIGAEPDGENINAGCGSTNLTALRAAVAAHGADAGIAHDGDADRCLAVDASGEVIDGDQILAVLAFALKEAGRLADNTVVVTVMSNLGLRLAMRDAGIALVETPVGDRHLVAAMREGRFVLGGEQSGHIILLDHATTGDGLLTALHLLATAAGRGQPLGELAKVMTRYPQVLVSVPGVDRSLVSTSSELTDAVRAAEAELGESGRVLVRPSGTEQVVRVMVEAVDSGQAHRLAGALADTVRRLPLASGAH
jgi:phosphoglucosamine mutase